MAGPVVHDPKRLTGFTQQQLAKAGDGGRDSGSVAPASQLLRDLLSDLRRA